MSGAIMQCLPKRQKITNINGKYKLTKRTTPEFSGTFPEECFAPQNTPRDNSDRPESWPWKTLPKLKPPREILSRPSSHNEVIGGSGRLSVSPNMKYGKIPCDKKLPPIAGVQDWRDLSPDLLRRDAAWNVLCKHCPRITPNSRREYFRRIVNWRKGIIDENERRNCINCRMQKLAAKVLDTDERARQEYERVVNRIPYSRSYYNSYSRDIKQIEVRDDSPTLNVSTKKDLLRRKQKPPCPPRIIQNTTETPDAAYTNCKVARYLELYPERRKNIHPKCKPLDQIFEPAIQSVLQPLKVVYKRKCLPGLLQKKTNNKRVEPQKYSLEYEVTDLGVLVNLPKNNPNLGKRHVSIPRNTSFIASTKKQSKKIDKPFFSTIPRFILPTKSNFV